MQTNNFIQLYLVARWTAVVTWLDSCSLGNRTHSYNYELVVATKLSVHRRSGASALDPIALDSRVGCQSPFADGFGFPRNQLRFYII
jgi:hypothetical protein